MTIKEIQRKILFNQMFYISESGTPVSNPYYGLNEKTMLQVDANVQEVWREVGLTYATLCYERNGYIGLPKQEFLTFQN